MFEEVHDFALGPAPVISISVRLAYERAMATIAGLNVRNVGIRGDALQRLVLDADKRIICRMNNKGGYGDPVNHIRGGGALIIVLGARESAVVRSYPVIEQSQGRHTAQPLYVEISGKHLYLSAKAP